VTVSTRSVPSRTDILDRAVKKLGGSTSCPIDRAMCAGERASERDRARLPRAR
jgi:hypothetical protein